MHDADPTPSPFGNLHHVALVVENLDHTVEQLERLGLGPFVSYPPLTEYVELDVPDVDAFRALRIKVCQVGPVALQLIEGKAGTIYGDFLAARGQGVFHLGFVVDDIMSARQQTESRGLGVLASGRRSDGSGFAYFDTQDDLGVTLLLRQSPPGD